MTFRSRALILTALALAACKDETLGNQNARIALVPELRGSQTALSSPAGIDLHDVALWSVVTATFRIDNDSPATLRIHDARVETAEGAIVRITAFSDEIGPRDSGVLEATFSPLVDGATATATLKLATNAGDAGNEEATARLTGIGRFVGEPNLEVCYVGTCYAIPEDCTPIDGACVLPALDFGNTPLSSTSTQQIRLANRPPAGTCVPPPGSEACTPVCVITFDQDPAGLDLGVGVSDPTSGFRLEGNVTLPFFLGTDEPQCIGTTDVLRRDLPLSVAFDAGAIEQLAVESKLHLESDQPGAPRIDIPLVANARQGPTAVAKLRVCGDQNPPPTCSLPDDIEPLARVYFDGSESYDSSQPDNPNAISGWSWQVIQAPPGADAGVFDFNGSETTPGFSMFLPIAGTYVVRLTVTSTFGVVSGVGPQSDVEVIAVPDSRASVQLVWDSPAADLDLHLVNVSQGDMVYGADSDCFWKNCKPTCIPANDCQPILWSDAEAAFQGGNPRLDVDDTNGLGPENISLDAPLAGRYRIYVHYYSLVSPDVVEPTTATIRIYIDGVLRNQYHRFIEPSDLWRVAQVEWTAESDALITEATSDAQGEVGAVKNVTTMPYPTGYYFGGTF